MARDSLPLTNELREMSSTTAFPPRNTEQRERHHVVSKILILWLYCFLPSHLPDMYVHRVSAIRCFKGEQLSATGKISFGSLGTIFPFLVGVSKSHTIFSLFIYFQCDGNLDDMKSLPLIVVSVQYVRIYVSIHNDLLHGVVPSPS